MSFTPLISIVLGSYNRIGFLKLTLESIRKEMVSLAHEIIVVDGGSTDGSMEWLLKQKDVISIFQHNRGVWIGNKIERKSWGYFMNLAFRAANGKYVCMLSDDCLIIPGAVKNGYNLFEKKLSECENIGAMAFYWRNWPYQQRYWVGSTFDKRIFVNHGMYLKKALEEVGFIDQDNYFFYYADADLCLKMWAKGYICIDSPNSYIEHYAHANQEVRKTNTTKEDLDLKFYLNKWKGIYYNSENGIVGEWLEREYHDSFNTANSFKLQYLKDTFMKRALKKIGFKK